jgi:hypothetical protein
MITCSSNRKKEKTAAPLRAAVLVAFYINREVLTELD